MKKRNYSKGIQFAILIGLVALFQSTLRAESPVKISFFTPYFSDDPLDYPESVMSAPKSFIVFDPVVFGELEGNEHKTVVKALEPDFSAYAEMFGLEPGAEIPEEALSFAKELGGNRYSIRISGTVYDEMADYVPDDSAAIQSVSMGTDTGPDLVGKVEILEDPEFDTVTDNEFIDQIKLTQEKYPQYAPHPFVGRFQLESTEAQFLSGSNRHNVILTNAAGISSGASVKVSGNRTPESDIPLNVELNNSELRRDSGMINPVYVVIHDESIDTDNISEAFATINDHRVGLRMVDGRLELDRPLIAIAKTPPPGAINVVQVGAPGVLDHFIIKYKGVTEKFTWSYSR